jgi:hypothetical protein
MPQISSMISASSAQLLAADAGADALTPLSRRSGSTQDGRGGVAGSQQIVFDACVELVGVSNDDLRGLLPGVVDGLDQN